MMVAWGLSGQEPVLQVTLNADSIGVGAPLRLQLTSDEPLSGGQRWQWPTLEPGDTLPQGWEILATGPLDSMASPELDAGLRREQWVEVLSWDTGFKVIEPFVLQSDSFGSASSAPVLVQVGLPRIEADAAPMPLQGYRPYTWTWWERLAQVLPGLLAAIALLLGGWWAWNRWRKRDRTGPMATAPAAPEEPAHLIALRMLRALEAETPWVRGEEKQAQLLLSEAVRIHLQGTLGVKALERATEELADHLLSSPVRGMTPEDAEWLVRLLRQSDLVKFAKQTLSPDAHLHAVTSARTWVERTQPSEESSTPSTDDHA